MNLKRPKVESVPTGVARGYTSRFESALWFRLGTLHWCYDQDIQFDFIFEINSVFRNLVGTYFSSASNSFGTICPFEGILRNCWVPTELLKVPTRNFYFSDRFRNGNVYTDGGRCYGR